MATAHWEVGDRVELCQSGSTPKTGTVVRQAQMGQRRGKHTNAVAIRWDVVAAGLATDVWMAIHAADPPMLGESCVRNCHLIMASDAQ